MCLFEGKSETQDSQQDSQEYSQKEDKTEEVIRCQFCRGREFSKETDYLFHLSLFHFRKELLDKFPFKVCGF